ncbi:MAG: response regulator [Acidobacteriota bacterium]|nr:MAG: response regulator [Acidobacteriota bacterium]
MRVLVVDDEPTLRTVISEVLEAEGYDVTVAPSGEEALALFDNQRFALVITDIVMGGTSGLDLLERVRANWPDTLVVLMTSYASISTAQEALRVAPRITSSNRSTISRRSSMSPIAPERESSFRDRAANSSTRCGRTPRSWRKSIAL